MEAALRGFAFEILQFIGYTSRKAKRCRDE